MVKRFSALTISNIVVTSTHHKDLIESGSITALLNLVNSEDIQTKRCI